MRETSRSRPFSTLLASPKSILVYKYHSAYPRNRPNPSLPVISSRPPNSYHSRIEDPARAPDFSSIIVGHLVAQPLITFRAQVSSCASWGGFFFKWLYGDECFGARIVRLESASGERRMVGARAGGLKVFHGFEVGDKSTQEG